MSRPGPTAQELAQAIRLGLEHRRWPFAPVEPPVPEPPTGIEVVPRLWPNYNTLQIRADARPGRFQKPMRLIRRVFKALLRPWLDVQTQFNHAVIESLDAHQRQLTEHLHRLNAYLRERPAALHTLRDRLDETHFEIARCREETAELSEQTRALEVALTAWREQVGPALDQAARIAEEHSTARLTTVVDELRRDWDARFGDHTRTAEARRLELEAWLNGAEERWRDAEGRCQNAEKLFRESHEKLHDTEVRLTELQNQLPVLRDESVNRELGWQGEIAQAGLWFNPAVKVQILDRKPKVVGVTERILEHIFVHTRLPAPPARVLDMGCSESTCAIELASLGYQVVGVDLRRLPLEHPNFRMVQANLADLPFPDQSFDVVVCLSTIEHVGLSWYADVPEWTTDYKAAEEAWRVLRPGGRLILTLPYGKPAETPVHRIYDAERLDKLLEKYQRVEAAYGVRDGESWSFTTDAARAGAAESAERVSAVALVVAEKA